MTDVKGRWALVTGASRGIGRLASLFLADHGCNLILHARKTENLREISDEILKKGVRIRTVQAELSDPSEVRSMLETIDSFGISVDLILNNAGLQIAYRTDFFETPVSDFETSFRVNTIAPAMICYHFLPKMIEKGFGRILNTTSGIRLEPEQAGYSASKAALDKITVDLGSKLTGSGVIINLTDPGWCRTDLGGPDAPNSPESTIPGIVAGLFVDDGKSGRIFPAQEFSGMTLEEAVIKAERDYSSTPY